LKAADLITTARKLLAAPATEADRRRGISTAYYALFRKLCEVASEELAGPDTARAQYQLFRSVDHRVAKEACEKVRGLKFPDEVITFADAFVALQEDRHAADYCPDRETTQGAESNKELGETAKLSIASNIVSQAEKAISVLDSVDAKHRRTFAVYVLLYRRDSRLKKPVALKRPPNPARSSVNPPTRAE
jgi:hypothetical protein